MCLEVVFDGGGWIVRGCSLGGVDMIECQK